MGIRRKISKMWHHHKFWCIMLKYVDLNITHMYKMPVAYIRFMKECYFSLAYWDIQNMTIEVEEDENK